MLKIAAVFMTTSAVAGLLISGPGIASISTVSSPPITTVKVKTIAIRAPAAASAELSATGGEKLPMFERPATIERFDGARDV